MIINYVGQMVGGEIVALLVEHLVVKLRGVDGYLTAYHIGEADRLSRLYPKSHNVGYASLLQFLALALSQCERVAHTHTGGCIVLKVLGTLTSLLQLLRGVVRLIGLTTIQQLTDILAVDVPALALAVGTILTSHTYTLVDMDAKPLERLDDVVLSSGDKTT